MAAKSGLRTDALSFLAELEERAYAFDFFSVLRRLECFYSNLPRLGRAARPGNEPVRLGQEPSLAFSPSAVAHFKTGSGDEPHRLANFFFGLFGPNGPLPIHLTEFARNRELIDEDPTFRQFADLFHHRLLLLFYRAWADANAVTSRDRDQHGRFDAYVGSLIGIGSGEMQNRDTAPDDAKLYMAGLFALKTRPAAGLETLLRGFFDFPFEVQEFIGEWSPIMPEDRSLLGSSATLGVDATLGRFVWGCQHRIRLKCGPLAFEDFRRMLPGGESLRRLKGLVRNYLGEELEWDLNITLEARAVPPVELGQAGQMGWTSWLGTRSGKGNAEEVVVHSAAIA